MVLKKITSPRNNTGWWLTFIVLIVFSVIIFALALMTPPFLNDDSLITLTYAKNIAAGNGFVFNHPPPVLGTTTPLFTLIVALLAVIFQHIEMPTLAIMFSASCWAGISWLFFTFRKQWQITNLEIISISALITFTPWSNFLGMEAYTFAFLLVLTISTFLDKKYLLTGLLSCLLFLTRGEGALIPFLLGVALISQKIYADKTFDKNLLLSLGKLVTGFGLLAIVWIFFAYITFGAVLPNTLYAKMAQGDIGFGNSLIYYLFNEWIPLSTTGLKFGSNILLNFWWVVIGFGIYRILVKKKFFIYLILWIALYIIGYTALNVPGYYWYFLPIHFVLSIVFAMGISELSQLILKAQINRKVRMALSVLVSITLIFFYVKPLTLYHTKVRGDHRAKQYIEIAEWFNKNTQPTESIAFIEIGYLGFYTENKIIDLAGLVLPDVTKNVSDNGFIWGFWHYKPDYYIYETNFDLLIGGIADDTRFEKEYQPVAKFSDSNQKEFVIFQRLEK